MIKVSKLTDYAILILHALSHRENERLSTEAIVEATSLGSATVRKIMNLLTTEGLVVSHRGAQGGYELAREQSAISVLDVINAIEGPVMLTECCDRQDQCTIHDHCTLQSRWRSVNQMISATLQRFTIADFYSPLAAKEHVLVYRP